jgi:hypothetical protein
VLVADGVFLQRPELDPCRDLRIHVDVGFDTVLRGASPATGTGGPASAPSSW